MEMYSGGGHSNASSGSIKGDMRGHCPPPVRGFPPLAPPPSKGKMAKISHYRQFFFDICTLRFAFCHLDTPPPHTHTPHPPPHTHTQILMLPLNASVVHMRDQRNTQKRLLFRLNAILENCD